MRRQPNRRQPLAPWGLAGFGGIVASRRQQQQAGQQQGCTDRSHQQATCQPYRVQLQALAVRIQPSIGAEVTNKMVLCVEVGQTVAASGGVGTIVMDTTLSPP
uniref:Uncharacterized protein n=1 Tax=Oryza sativa subsp. japonica TaxID=39947 RepID=Q6ZH27_ORYSJ|nr:hypothetical protein [Oryza sativa Japonica Group]